MQRQEKALVQLAGKLGSAGPVFVVVVGAGAFSDSRRLLKSAICFSISAACSAREGAFLAALSCARTELVGGLPGNKPNRSSARINPAPPKARCSSDDRVTTSHSRGDDSKVSRFRVPGAP